LPPHQVSSAVHLPHISSNFSPHLRAARTARRLPFTHAPPRRAHCLHRAVQRRFTAGCYLPAPARRPPDAAGHFRLGLFRQRRAAPQQHAASATLAQPHPSLRPAPLHYQGRSHTSRRLPLPFTYACLPYLPCLFASRRLAPRGSPLRALRLPRRPSATCTTHHSTLTTRLPPICLTLLPTAHFCAFSTTNEHAAPTLPLPLRHLGSNSLHPWTNGWTWYFDSVSEHGADGLSGRDDCSRNW